jgi:hypothetical protein
MPTKFEGEWEEWREKHEVLLFPKETSKQRFWCLWRSSGVLEHSNTELVVLKDVHDRARRRREGIRRRELAVARRYRFGSGLEWSCIN